MKRRNRKIRNLIAICADRECLLAKRAVFSALALAVLGGCLSKEETGPVSLDDVRSQNAIADPVLGKLEQEVAKTAALHDQHGALMEMSGERFQESFLIDARGDGSFEMNHVPANDKREILLTGKARELLFRIKSPSEVHIAPKKTGIEAFRQSFGPQIERSIDPDFIKDKPLPPVVVTQQERERLAQSTAYQNCNAAQLDFARDVEPVIYGAGFKPAELTDSKKQTIRNVISRFDQSCLEAIKPGSLDGQGVPLRQIAILEQENGNAICMAGYLGKGIFITARHCQERFGSRVFVSLADRSKLRLPVVYIDEKLGSGGGAGSDDVVRFRAPGLAQDGPVPGLSFAQPVAGARLRLIGYFLYADPAATFRDGSLPQWTDALRAARSGDSSFCRAVDVTPPSSDGGLGCIQHSCQAFPGFSGAPIFAKVGNQWSLAGIHTGENNEGASCSSGYAGREGRGYFERIGNLGVRIPTAAKS